MCPRKRMKHRSNPINCSDRIGTRKNPRLGRGFRFLGRNQTISRSLQFTSSHILHLCWNPENDDFNEIFFNLHLCLGSQKNIKLSRTFQFFSKPNLPKPKIRSHWTYKYTLGVVSAQDASDHQDYSIFNMGIPN